MSVRSQVSLELSRYAFKLPIVKTEKQGDNPDFFRVLAYRSWQGLANGIKCSSLALMGKLIKLPMKLITDEFAFSLAPEGWNSYCALLAEYEQNPEIELEQTTFFRFFNDEKISTVRYLNDLLFLHDPQKRDRTAGYQFYLGTWPWGGLTPADSLVGGTPFGKHYDRLEGKRTRDLWGYGRNLWYDPQDSYTLQSEWDLTLQHYASLKRGYFPLLYRSFPRVALLVRRDGERRALIVDGHHRLAILSYLGVREVTVEVTQVVEESQVEQWYYVQQGHCQPEAALEIFTAFFELNGRERLTYLTPR
jgi:hypothetical protein